MEYLLATSPTEVQIVSAERQPLTENSVRVAIAHAGICHSDTAQLASGAGPFPMRLGHEAAGTVVESSAPGYVPGDRVVAYVDDAYATEVVCAPGRLVRIHDDCRLQDAALAEPLACVIGGLEMLNLDVSTPVAVVGAGFMGLLAIRLLAARGLEVVAIDPQQRSRDLATRLGAARTLSPAEVGTDAEGAFEVVIEAVGRPGGIEGAGPLVRTAGTLGILGYHQSNGGMRSVPMERWNFHGLRVISMHHRDPRDVLRWIDRAQRLSALGIVRPAELVDAALSLHELPAALTAPGQNVKSLLTL